MDTDDAFFLDGGRYQSLIRDVIVRMAPVLFCTQVRSMGVENPLTIHEIYAALTPSNSQSDWASEFAAVEICVPVHPMSVF